MARTKKTVGPVCHWKHQSIEEDYYETDCGQTFVTFEGTPEEHKMHFCCFCGRRLKSVRHE